MTRPKDIPADVWEMAREILGEPDTVTRPKNIERAARALLAYGQSRADEATERAARVCDEAAAAAANHDANAADPLVLLVFQQINTMLTMSATAIRSQK